MNKALLVFSFATVAILTACEDKGKSETVIRETTIIEVEKDDAKGNSFSLSVDEDGSSVEIHAKD